MAGKTIQEKFDEAKRTVEKDVPGCGERIQAGLLYHRESMQSLCVMFYAAGEIEGQRKALETLNA